jgi:ATPase subunit of ABC transporter with duplicated ATPase domains
VLFDEKIQAMGITREQVTEVLASVGFTDDGKAKPLHAVSTLSGGWRMKLAMVRTVTSIINAASIATVTFCVCESDELVLQ